jgi:hypothetical protein
LRIKRKEADGIGGAPPGAPPASCGPAPRWAGRRPPLKEA